MRLFLPAQVKPKGLANIYGRRLLPGLCIIALALTIIPYYVLAADNSWKSSIAAGKEQLNNQSISKAESYFRQAVNEVDRVSHTADDKVDCLNELANVLALQDKTNEATAIYRQSLEILEKAYGHNSKKLLPALFTLGSINESEGDHRAAMIYYKRAMAINEKDYGPHVFPASNSTNNVEHSNNLRRPSQGYLPDLVQQSGLDASKTLENLLPRYNKDMLTEEDSSDKDLISNFQSEINNNPRSNILSGIAVSPSADKQADKIKRAGGI